MIFDGEKQVYILSEQEYDEMFNGLASSNLELIRKTRKLEKAKRALCEASRMALSEETDISKIYDIVHPVVCELNEV